MRLIAPVLGRTLQTAGAIDEGYDFHVVVVDDEWVFRFPRRAGVAAALEAEIELLPRITPALPVAVPELRRRARFYHRLGPLVRGALRPVHRPANAHQARPGGDRQGSDRPQPTTGGTP